jgi:hypothetical protein
MKISVIGKCAEQKLAHLEKAQDEKLRGRRMRGMKICIVGEGA